MSEKAAIPHPIPYQGSKRRLAAEILKQVDGRHFRRLYEPLAGSAAVTLAAASRDLADEYVLAEISPAFAGLWRKIINSPNALADEYERIWSHQLTDPRHFLRVRDEFNASPESAQLLYLLARCVKNSPRFNSKGEFNQSADKRRKGTQPAKMRVAILGASGLLRGKTTVVCKDFAKTIAKATPDDLIYLDPPFEGVSSGSDSRYIRGVPRKELIEALTDLNTRGVPYLLSYDGATGNKTYGTPLPKSLRLRKLSLRAGRSSQATLHGREEITVESLYVSRGITKAKARTQKPQRKSSKPRS